MSKQAQAVTPLVFFQLQKVDEAKRLVYGRAVQEVPDRVGEIFDYETSVPFFKAWGASQFEASLGKSNGNLRAMHKDVAAGIVIPGGLTYHDKDKAIDICAKVTDDQEFSKCLDGTYTGFSIGGRYAKKWEDPELKKTRYTADPSEISLVDRPCIPSATFFEIQKADGTLEKRDFAKPAEEEAEAKVFPPAKDEPKKGDKKTVDGKECEFDGKDWVACKVEPAGEVQKAETVDEYDIEATPAQVDEFCKLLAESKTPFAKVLEDLKKGHPITREAEAKETPAEEAKETPAEQAAEDKAGVEMTEAEKAALKAKQAKEKAAPEKVDPATDLAKAGARNSKADAAELQKAHDALNAAGARCNKAFIFADSDPGDVTTSKDNPGNSGATAQAKIDSPSTAIQDKAEPSGDLKKALDETAALRKIVEDQAKDIALLKAQPATPRIRLRAVGKGEETLPLDEKVDKVEAVKDAHGKEHGVATLIKGIHQTGGEDLYKFR